MDIFPTIPTFDFLGKKRIAFAISLTAIAISLLTPLVKKPNWGIDFVGGTELQVKFDSAIADGDVRLALEAADIGDANIQQFGNATENEFLIRVGRASLFTNAQFSATVEPKLREALAGLREGKEGVDYEEREGDQVTLTAKDATLTTDGVRTAIEAAGFKVQDVRAIVDAKSYSVLFKGVGEKVESALKAKLADKKFVVQRVEQVGAAVGNELKWGAVKSILLAILLILLYVGFRFDFRFAPGGVVALAHDAIITVGYYTVSGAEINTTTIAAVLTIIGYSINDTIVIFDRVRENMQKYQGRELEKTINDTLNETLSRTILTSFTVFLSLFGLVFYAVGSLQEFAVAMLVGLISGTYSTVYIASPLVIWMEDVIKARKAASASMPTPATAK